MPAVDIGARIAQHFPIGNDLIRLEVVVDGDVPAPDSSGPASCAVFRLIIWEERDGMLSIRDVKEQQVYMGWPVLYDDAERVAAFFEAYGEVFAEVADRGVEVVERLMPHDLINADALKLKRAHTREDFAAALRAKRRLGRYLEASKAP